MNYNLLIQLVLLIVTMFLVMKLLPENSLQSKTILIIILFVIITYGLVNIVGDIYLKSKNKLCGLIC